MNNQNNEKNDEKNKEHRKLPKNWDSKYWWDFGEYADEVRDIWRELLDCIEDDDIRAFALFYKYTKSLDSMSEELTHMLSRFRNLQKEYDEIFGDENENDDFMAWIKDKKLRRAVEKLTDRQQQVIKLRFYHRYKQHEIAELIDRSPNSVSEILHRALESLMNDLMK